MPEKVSRNKSRGLKRNATAQDGITTQGSQSMVGEETVVMDEYTEVFVWGDHRHGQLGIDSQLQQSQHG